MEFTLSLFLIVVARAAYCFLACEKFVIYERMYITYKIYTSKMASPKKANKNTNRVIFQTYCTVRIVAESRWRSVKILFSTISRLSLLLAYFLRPSRRVQSVNALINEKMIHTTAFEATFRNGHLSFRFLFRILFLSFFFFLSPSRFHLSNSFLTPFELLHECN